MSSDNTGSTTRSVFRAIVAVVGILDGLWNVLLGLVALGLGGMLSSIGASGGTNVGLTGAFFLIWGFGMWVTVIGAMLDQSWGTYSALIIWGIEMLRSFWDILIKGTIGPVALFILGMNLSIVLLAGSEADIPDFLKRGGPTTPHISVPSFGIGLPTSGLSDHQLAEEVVSISEQNNNDAMIKTKNSNVFVVIRDNSLGTKTLVWANTSKNVTSDRLRKFKQLSQSIDIDNLCVAYTDDVKVDRTAAEKLNVDCDSLSEIRSNGTVIETQEMMGDPLENTGSRSDLSSGTEARTRRSTLKQAGLVAIGGIFGFFGDEILLNNNGIMNGVLNMIPGGGKPLTGSIVGGPSVKSFLLRDLVYVKLKLEGNPANWPKISVLGTTHYGYRGLIVNKDTGKTKKMKILYKSGGGGWATTRSWLFERREFNDGSETERIVLGEKQSLTPGTTFVFRLKNPETGNTFKVASMTYGNSTETRSPTANR